MLRELRQLLGLGPFLTVNSIEDETASAIPITVALKFVCDNQYQDSIYESGKKTSV